MPKLPRIPSILVLRALKRARFYEFHQSGSHIQLHNLDNPQIIPSLINPFPVVILANAGIQIHR